MRDAVRCYTISSETDARSAATSCDFASGQLGRILLSLRTLEEVVEVGKVVVVLPRGPCSTLRMVRYLQNECPSEKLE